MDTIIKDHNENILQSSTSKWSSKNSPKVDTTLQLIIFKILTKNSIVGSSQYLFLPSI